MSHFWDNFDKLLVTLLLLIIVGMAMWLVLRDASDSALQWIEGLAGQLVSALLALLGANKIATSIKPGAVSPVESKPPVRGWVPL